MKKFQVWVVETRLRKDQLGGDNLLSTREMDPALTYYNCVYLEHYSCVVLPVGIEPKGPRGGLASYTGNVSYLVPIPDRHEEEVDEDDANHGVIFCPHCYQISREDNIFPNVCGYCCSDVTEK